VVWINLRLKWNRRVFETDEKKTPGYE